MSTKTTSRPDIYIAFVCAAGTDLTDTKTHFAAQLSIVGYQDEVIKVSTLIADLLDLPNQKDEALRIRQLMKAGDEIRKNSENAYGVASAVVAEIKRLRACRTGVKPRAYLIDSLKNPAEIDLLRQIYRDNLYVVSVYLSKEERTKYLSRVIAKSRKQPPEKMHSDAADELISEDEKGIGSSDQDVLNTFPRADYFVDVEVDLANQIMRFVSLVFGDPFITPTIDEFAMAAARLAALQSCDLSRRVGAVIVGPYDQIIATGCNEVPAPNGGFYREGGDSRIKDNRDFHNGNDPNYVEIQKTLIEVLKVLQESEHVGNGAAAEVIAEDLLHGGYRQLMKNARIRNLIEFGRVVHAEMHALSQAARDGRGVLGARLYCTTFPCHGCARHIIAAGISEVIFIEPYPKSLTKSLYENEIEMVDRSDTPPSESKVRFRPFHGVAPNLYPRVFEYRKRKDDHGAIAKWEPKKTPPIGSTFGVALEEVELGALEILAQTLDRIRVSKPNPDK